LCSTITHTSQRETIKETERTYEMRARSKGKNGKNRLRNEEGAMVIEATMSVTLFMFVIIMLLSFVNLCIAQSRIGVALNQTAKEISQYTYIYSLSGLNDIQAQMNAGFSGVKSDIENAEEAVVSSINGIIGLAKGSKPAGEVVETVGTSIEELEKLATKIATSEDRKAWVMSVLKICGNEGYEALKGLLGGALTKGLMQKHLIASSGIECDRYLKRLGVEDGVKGLNTFNSALFVNGTDEIQLICKYKISIINLLNKEFTFSFVQTAHTKVWGAKALAGADSDYEAKDAATGKFVYVTGEAGDKFGEYAAKAKPVPGYVDVIIHASNTGKMQVMYNGAWTDVTPAELNKWLDERGYDGTPVRLISCGAGSDTSKIAQEVANELKVNVLAPSDTVWAYPNGKLIVGPDASKNTGKWNVFSCN